MGECPAGQVRLPGKGAERVDVAIILIVLLVVVGVFGAGGYLLRDFGRQVLARDAATVSSELAERQEQALADIRNELEKLRGDVRAAVTEGDAQLARLRERRELAQSELDAMLAKARSELDRAERVREDAEHAVADATAANGLVPAEALPAASLAVRVDDGRLTALVELYRLTARVETALAQLTAPVLLPGEPYEAPDDLPAEALDWDNWKDVGETAYALGDYLMDHRLLLAPETGQDLEEGITSLRVALTRSIYPNLQVVPSPDQSATLRAGLADLATTLPRLRQRLEADYRTLTEADGSPGS